MPAELISPVPPWTRLCRRERFLTILNCCQAKILYRSISSSSRVNALTILALLIASSDAAVASLNFVNSCFANLRSERLVIMGRNATGNRISAVIKSVGPNEMFDGASGILLLNWRAAASIVFGPPIITTMPSSSVIKLCIKLMRLLVHSWRQTGFLYDLEGLSSSQLQR